MANEYIIDLGAGAAGWTVRVVTFYPNWSGSADTLDAASEVYNATSFVTDTYAARTLGGLTLTESGSNPGYFTGDLQAGITEAGTYPVIYYRQLGGSFDSSTDTPVSFAGSTITVGTSITGDGLTYTPGVQATAARQTLRYYQGSGIPFTFTPTNATAVTAANYRCIVSIAGGAIYDTYTVANGGMTFASGTRVFTVNPTIADSASWSRYESLNVELWRYDADDVTVPEGRARINLIATSYGADTVPPGNDGIDDIDGGSL